MKEEDIPENVMAYIIEVCVEELERERGHVDPEALERVIREVIEPYTVEDIARIEGKLKRR